MKKLDERDEAIARLTAELVAMKAASGLWQLMAQLHLT
jgi:hypothetical protein